jgi:2,4-dienoyl-CoA reductase-like NADH-dependent reductase (Old Yellow Enzyme family)
MSSLFQQTSIGDLVLRNRIVRSATCDCLADGGGHVTDEQIDLFSTLAAGGVGLIITGITYSHTSGQIVAHQSSLADDDCIPGLARLTAAVHEQGGKVAVQLFHGGRDCAEFLKGTAELAMAPSSLRDDPYFPEEYRSITEDEIWGIIDSFGSAASRAKEAGFDAVQLHAAHAFLPSQFLSPYANRRDDDFGGSLENRLRFHHEIYQAMRADVGGGYPLLIKLGVEDGFPGGLEFGEGLEAAQRVAAQGWDALEISQGLRGEWYDGTEWRTRIHSVDDEGYFRTWAKEIKARVNVPVITVGGLRSPGLMEEVLQRNEADLVSLCRPLIRQPGLIADWASGKMTTAECDSCNKCLEALRDGRSLRCWLEPEDGQPAPQAAPV